MTTIKSYTSVEQSHKLVKILPIESADMFWSLNNQNHPPVIGKCCAEYGGMQLPAWSLAALMSVFPKEEGSCVSISYGYYDANGNYVKSWLCCYEKEGESTDDYIIEIITAENPIDCCYEMILKLKEKGLL